MGHLKEKYTEEYFTGVDKKGKKLSYGATILLDNNGEPTLRDHDKKILKKIDFSNKNVLALGCGRGEELAYAIENGANPLDSIGVDFSTAAIKISKKLFKSKKLNPPQLFTEDALVFVSRFQKDVEKKRAKKFDVVIMFDFVEHVPRSELSQVILKLKSITKANAILAINTPAYRFDNDVLRDGYDERNKVGLLDMSDEIQETKGMHCNKYSVVSFQAFMEKQGYHNITEAHYFVNADCTSDSFKNVSYNRRWEESRQCGAPVLGNYSDDSLEIPYTNLPDVKLLKFDSGKLNGISVFITEEYKDICFPGGDTDIEMIESIEKLKPHDKTIFDVGTFMGTSAMLFSEMVGVGGRVLGFEPNPSNRNRTFMNLSHNPDFAGNISIHNLALSSENKKQQMLLSPNVDIGHSSTSRLEGSHSTIHGSDLPMGFEDVEVEVETLDKFIVDTNVKPDIIKVDIEGAEYDFLLGAVETIRKFHPTFYIELHSEYCALKCTEILISEGYQIEVLHEENDNRLMIKADLLKPGNKVTLRNRDVEAYKMLNNAYSIIRGLHDDIKCLNQKLNSRNEERIALIEERARLLSQIDEIVKTLGDVFASRSWKITIPLRRMVSILKGVMNK